MKRACPLSALGLIMITVVLLAGSVQAQEPTYWGVETVDRARSTGFTSLKADQVGFLHLSYMACDDTCALKYAVRNGTDGWQTQVVESGIDIGAFASLALDAENRPHISYSALTASGSDSDLKYATFDGTDWHINVAESRGQDSFTSLALDAQDRPHITYWDNYDNALKYATLDGEDWKIVKVGSSWNLGFTSSLALDGDGQPHLSCWDRKRFLLGYASYDGSTWQIEPVAASTGMFSSLVLDAEDRPHIAYYRGTGLQYAFRDNTSWHTQSVERTSAGRFVSLVLDKAGQPHIAYEGSTDSYASLKYAYYDGSDWRIEQAATGAGGVTDISLALDREGQPHICYTYTGGRAVKCIYRTTSVPPEAEDLSTALLPEEDGLPTVLVPKVGGPPVNWWMLITASVLLVAGLFLRHRARR